MGCTALPSLPAPSLALPSWATGRAPAAKEVATGQVTIEFRNGSGAVKGTKAAPIGEATTLSQVLSRTGATRGYNRVQIEILREQANGGRHKMNVQVDKYRKAPMPLYDYHLRNGDRIAISEDSTTILDDMLKQGLGPMAGGLTGNRK